MSELLADCKNPIIDNYGSHTAMENSVMLYDRETLTKEYGQEKEHEIHLKISHKISHMCDYGTLGIEFKRIS